MRKYSYRHLFTLLLLYLLFFWSDFATYSPGMDSMTYGAVARHMAESGNYLVPHYNEQAYNQFFQHPPLALWLMAFSMKAIRLLFGDDAYHSNLILKFLPSLFAAICVGIVYAWMRKLRGDGIAFWAALVLLTSTRFVKYSKGFMLDPFLATFSVAAVYLAFRESAVARVRSTFLVASGLSIAAAFLSKGLFAFAPLAVVLISRKNRREVALVLSGVALPILVWFAFGDAANYLHHYYVEHVAGRVGSHPFRDHLEPARNLLKVYWPWLPLFLLGAFVITREAFSKEKLFSSGKRFWSNKKFWERALRVLRDEEFAILLSALAFLGGFTLVASFLEQYHVAFYPFAAMVVAIGIPTGWLRHPAQLEKGVLAIAAGFAVFMLFFPYALRSPEYKNPLRSAFEGIRPLCSVSGSAPASQDGGPRRLLVSTNVADIWYGLAIGSWYTDYDIRSDVATKHPEETRSDLLFATLDEPKSEKWEMTNLQNGPYALYRRSDSLFCDSGNE